MKRKLRFYLVYTLPPNRVTRRAIVWAKTPTEAKGLFAFCGMKFLPYELGAYCIGFASRRQLSGYDRIFYLDNPTNKE